MHGRAGHHDTRQSSEQKNGDAGDQQQTLLGEKFDQSVHGDCSFFLAGLNFVAFAWAISSSSLASSSRVGWRTESTLCTSWSIAPPKARSSNCSARCCVVFWR